MLKQQDLEAQKTSSSSQADRSETLQPKYATSGRGGAGNLTDASNLAAATKDHIGNNPILTEQQNPSARYYGRGGAGNFKSNNVIDGVAPRETELQEMSRQPDPFADNESGLKEPEQVHLSGDRSNGDS